MAGTNIDASAVSRAGTTYTGVSQSLTTAGNGLREHGGSAESFGTAYSDEGAAFCAAITKLGEAVNAWRDGSQKVGSGLTNSSSAHRSTDQSGANSVTSTGNG